MQSMQLTDWLVVIFVVAIVVVLVDGVRRKLAERRSRVVMKLERNIPQDVDPEELPNSELPNGGARTIERGDEPPPSLRTLQARRKRSFRSPRPAEDSGVRAVPVLLDTVDIEEERIEHTNVFGDPHAVAASEVDDFGAAEAPVHDADTSLEPAAEADDELIDGLDEEYEEDAMLAPEIARKEPGYMDTRYMGRRDDDDEDEYEDEEEYEDDEEEEDEDEEEDFEEFDDDLDEIDDEDEEEDDYDDEDEDDDYDDEEDEDEDDYDDEEDEEEDEELDELEGLPEDDWGSEEEESRLVDDYENEPMPLQGAFDKAASTLDKVASQAATQIDKVTSQAATRLDQVATHAASQFDRAAAQAASHLKRPPRDAEQERIEPGFDGDMSAEQFDDSAFSEDFSATWADDDLDTTDAIVPEQAAERPQHVAAKRDQGELFGEAPARGSNARDVRDARKGRESREESRLMAALQKAVPARAPQPEPEPEPAAPQIQEVIIINVMARHGQMLHGGDLLRVLQAQGMRLGDMSIFHRHADSSGTGPTMFSMANMVKPGTFDLATMEDFATPGVSFFLQMPNKLGNMNCFEKMLVTASAVRDAFDAELKDEQRSTFTRQTVEHCRQRVRDLELKLLSRK